MSTSFDRYLAELAARRVAQREADQQAARDDANARRAAQDAAKGGNRSS